MRKAIEREHCLVEDPSELSEGNERSESGFVLHKSVAPSGRDLKDIPPTRPEARLPRLLQDDR